MGFSLSKIGSWAKNAVSSITGGDLLSAGASILGTSMANTATAKSASKQMQFQGAMSNSAHQREVADLRAAGLNPILSAKYGGASTPQGASYIAHDELTPGVNSALSLRMNKANVALANENRINVSADTDKKNQETSNLRFMKAVLNAQKENYEASSAYSSMQTLESMRRSDYLAEQALGQRLTNVGIESDLVEKLWRAGFFRTPYGKRLLEMKEHRSALGGIGGYIGAGAGFTSDFLIQQGNNDRRSGRYGRNRRK